MYLRVHKEDKLTFMTNSVSALQIFFLTPIINYLFVLNICNEKSNIVMMTIGDQHENMMQCRIETWFKLQ